MGTSDVNTSEYNDTLNKCNSLNVSNCRNVKDSSCDIETKCIKSDAFTKSRGSVNNIVNIVKVDRVSVPCNSVTESECKLAVCLDHDYVKKNVSMSCIKFAFINVCGLSSKIDIPDFIEFESRDVVALAETKLLSYDNINIEGYTVFPKASYIVEGNKKKRYKGKWGKSLIKLQLV